jgi:hypothetical protein
MSLSSLSNITKMDPGQLKGGVRSHKVTLNDLSAEFLRDARQNQDVFQTARAFSGAVNFNNLTQSEAIEQAGTAANSKEVKINPSGPADNVPEKGFPFKWIQETITGVEAANYLARGLANNNQDQLAGQSGYASMIDFDGNMSEAVNNLFQDELVVQDLELTEIKTYVEVPLSSDEWNNSRFRTILLNAKDHDAHAILSSTQRQGYTTADPNLKGNPNFDNPVTQFGAADGAIVENNLAQSVAAKQTNNVLMENTYDLRRDPGDKLSPRTTEFDLNVSNNTAINSETAYQSQALIQQALGGVDESGQMTESGGFVQNTATQLADLYEEGHVLHITNVIA